MPLIDLIIHILLVLGVLLFVFVIVGAKIKKILVYIKDGIPEEFMTLEGIVCLIGIFLLAVIVFSGESLSFVLCALSPDSVKASVIQNFSSTKFFFVVAFLFGFIGNLIFLGYTKLKK